MVPRTHRSPQATLPGRRARRVKAVRELRQCLAATQQHRRSTTHRKAPYAEFAVARGRRRTTDGQEGRQGAGGTPRLPGKEPGVAGTRSWRDVSCGTGSGPCRVRGDGRRAARRVTKGWRARCRETRRGRRMRRQGNTRRRAMPHHGAGSGYPDGYRVAHWNSTHSRSAPGRRVAAAGRGSSIPKQFGKHCGGRSLRFDLARC